ncbi:hypothetical protein Acr_27g0005300 [Actinidia rufa]|uniref:Uncharacterized protein n=1 Tax=Actinidia rufa TaxID=165716 RepID=A0A7J0H6X8_9ERIC|nr:hypothetical protein Acr_27g0005300 [Actinidia rufa]
MAVDENEFDVLLAASDDGKSDWVLDSGSAYHLYRDRERCSLHMQHARDVYGWRTTRLAELLAEGQSGSAWQTGDAKGCSFEANGGILRVSKGNKEMLWGKKTRGLYRLEGNVQTGGATVRHGSSGISKENGQGKQPLHRSTQSKRRGTWRIQSGTRAQGDALGYVRKSGQTRVMQPVQDVHREAQRRRPIVRTREERWSHDNSQSDVLCCAPRWGVRCAPVGVQGTSSYGGARSEVVRKDNLKTSDYPPVGWRGRLLSPAYLDESKPTWMSPSPIAKPKLDWSSYGVSM